MSRAFRICQNISSLQTQTHAVQILIFSRKVARFLPQCQTGLYFRLFFSLSILYGPRVNPGYPIHGPLHNNSSRSVPRLQVFLSSKSSDFYYCLNCFQPLKSFLPKLPDCFKLKWFTNARDNHKISTTVKIGSDQFTISIDIRRIRTCRLTEMNYRAIVTQHDSLLCYRQLVHVS